MKLMWIMWVYDIVTWPTAIPRRLIELIISCMELYMDNATVRHIAPKIRARP